MKLVALFAGFTILSLTLPAPLLAQPRPSLLSWDRLAFSAGAEREVLAIPQSPELDKWDAVAVGVYDLMLYPSKPDRVLLQIETRFMQPLDYTTRPSGRIGLKFKLF